MGIHRTPNENDKELIKRSHTENGSIRCYVNGHAIEDETQIEYHHIQPFSFTETTENESLAPVCKDHHRRIGLLSIEEFRARLDLEHYFQDKNIVRLDDIIESKSGREYGQSISYEQTDSSIRIYFNNKSEHSEYQVYECRASQFRYFYILLPVRYIKNDAELQPRPLELRRMWELYRHLLTHTQLAPAVCRLVDGHILLFDGQHKSAAQIWAGRSEIECKVYLSPDVKTLKDTNLTAHDKLRQMPFYTSILINKWADIFREEWGEYCEGSAMKSEKGFMNFLITKGRSRSDSKKMMESNIYDSILEDPNSNITEYISEKNRTRSNPLTTNAVKITFFRHFIAPPPLDIDLEQSDELRENERKNVVTLLNVFVDETLDGKWNPETKDAQHKKAERFYSIGSIKASVAMFRDVVAQILNLYDAKDRERIFLRRIEEQQTNLIRQRLRHMLSHEMWSNPSVEIDNNLRINNISQVRDFFTSKNLTVNWILGGIGV